ncbi:MAG: hypothetical protein V4597_08460 [Pseudomonadota bacterium]
MIVQELVDETERLRDLSERTMTLPYRDLACPRCGGLVSGAHAETHVAYHNAIDAALRAAGAAIKW